MNVCKLFWSWLMFAAMPLYIGGSNKQSASTTNNSTAIDKRLVTDGESVGVSADNSNVTVNKTSTDLGAVTKAFDFATSSTKAVSEDFGKVLNLAGDSLSFAKETAKLSGDTQAKATDQVTTAFKAMQSAVTGRDQLVTVGMIIAGVVGLAAFGGKIKL